MAQKPYINHDADMAFAIHKPKPQQKTSKCLVYLLAMFVILLAILLAFSLLVLRIKTPSVRIHSIAVKKLTSGNNGNKTLPFFNVTLVTEIALENPNIGKFGFENCSAVVLYEGMKVGEKVIGEGLVTAKGRKTVNVTVDVRSNLLPEVGNLASDIDSGMVRLNGYAKFSGEVKLMNFLKKHRNREMNCTMNLNLKSSKIQDLVCQ